MAKAVWLKQGSEKYYPAPYWPIGSIYISVVNTNPSQWFGGTWVRFAKGRALVGVDDVAGDPDLTTVLKTGGEYFHTLTINEMPSHYHGTYYDNFSFTTMKSISGSSGKLQVGNSGRYGFASNNGYDDLSVNNGTGRTGGGQSHNNMPPYITVYMWRRVS